MAKILGFQRVLMGECVKNDVKSVWITANAGSGKTTALTERVVRLLLLGVAPEHIVCITYTKAAASEMRTRVIGMLRDLLLLEDAACAARVEKLLGMPPTNEQLLRARQLFGLLIDSPTGGLQLTTIHGFCQSILRRFPMEAGIAPHFTVLDEAAADDVLRRAKHQLLTSLDSADVWLTDAINVIGARGGESQFESWASNIIVQRRVWEEIWRAQSPDSLRAHIYALHALEVGITQRALDKVLVSCISADEAALIREHLPQLLANEGKNFQLFAQNLAAWLVLSDEERRTNPAMLRNTFITQKGTLRTHMLSKKEFPPEHPLAITIAGIATRVERYATQSIALACAEESFAVAVFARALIDTYALAKEEIHALDYDDLITHTLRLIQHPETLGWVMSKLDYRIDHLLIDEAQDNSSDMWQLAEILVEELVAATAGMGNGNLPRSLLVVGDEKQSIYSFQGAAPEQFERYRARFTSMLDGSASPLQAQLLSHSYRSANAVLKFVNQVCVEPKVQQAIQSTGAPQPHLLTRDDASGLVALYPPIPAPEKLKQEPMTIPLAYQNQLSVSQQLADKIADTIHHWLIVEKRPINAGDILILVKNRHPMVMPLIRALERRAIPVAGLDRLRLSDHLAVRDLLALMAWCMNVGDDLALAQVLRSPLMGWSDEQLRAAAHGRPSMLWQQLSDPWLAKARTWVTDSPYDFLTKVLEVSGRRKDFARRFGEEVHEVLDELKTQAANIPSSLSPTLADFYAWIMGSERSIKREQENGDADKLRIMTVHGAKGLEAPIVILADTVSMPTTQRERLFPLLSAQHQLLPVLAMSDQAKLSTRLDEAKTHKKTALEAEYYRLLYVAMTRPRNELHIFGGADEEGEVKNSTWYSVAHEALRTCGAEEKDGVLVLADSLPHRGRVGVGALEAKAEPDNAPLLTSPLQGEELPAWAITAPFAETAPKMLTPSSITSHAEPSPYAKRGKANARERGVRIHRVLELLTVDSTAEDIEQLVHYFSPDWEEKERKKIVSQIHALFTQEHWLWQRARKAEVSVAGEIEIGGRSYPVSGQIDLLVETSDAVIILDYKTGTQVPTCVSEVPLNYILQLKIYQALISQIYTDIPVRCAIAWTAAPSLMWLDEAVKVVQFEDANMPKNQRLPLDVIALKPYLWHAT